MALKRDVTQEEENYLYTIVQEGSISIAFCYAIHRPWSCAHREQLLQAMLILFAQLQALIWSFYFSAFFAARISLPPRRNYITFFKSCSIFSRSATKSCVKDENVHRLVLSRLVFLFFLSFFVSTKSRILKRSCFIFRAAQSPLLAQSGKRFRSANDIQLSNFSSLVEQLCTRRKSLFYVCSFSHPHRFFIHENFARTRRKSIEFFSQSLVLEKGFSGSENSFSRQSIFIIPKHFQFAPCINIIFDCTHLHLTQSVCLWSVINLRSADFFSIFIFRLFFFPVRSRRTYTNFRDNLKRKLWYFSLNFVTLKHLRGCQCDLFLACLVFYWGFFHTFRFLLSDTNFYFLWGAQTCTCIDNWVEKRTERFGNVFRENAAICVTRERDVSGERKCEMRVRSLIRKVDCLPVSRLETLFIVLVLCSNAGWSSQCASVFEYISSTRIIALDTFSNCHN